jgi:hypothetical protein
MRISKGKAGERDGCASYTLLQNVFEFGLLIPACMNINRS